MEGEREGGKGREREGEGGRGREGEGGRGREAGREGGVTDSVFGLGVFGMARRHALVSLRHVAPFFLRITIII